MGKYDNFHIMTSKVAYALRNIKYNEQFHHSINKFEKWIYNKVHSELHVFPEGTILSLAGARNPNELDYSLISYYKINDKNFKKLDQDIQQYIMEDNENHDIEYSILDQIPKEDLLEFEKSRNLIYKVPISDKLEFVISELKSFINKYKRTKNIEINGFLMYYFRNLYFDNDKIRSFLKNMYISDIEIDELFLEDI